MRTIDEIIIHCAGTKPDWMAGKTAAAKRDEIDRWHRDKGWTNGFGYHGLLDRPGSVVTGRDVNVIGAHAKGHNRRSLGVVLVGGYGAKATDKFSDHFTPAQDRALRQWIEQTRSDHPSIAKVSGHNEYSNKGCPGFDVTEWLNSKPAKPTNLIGSLLAAILGLFSKPKGN